MGYDADRRVGGVGGRRFNSDYDVKEHFVIGSHLRVANTRRILAESLLQ